MKVNIRCIICNSLDYINYYAYIYDKNNNLIFKCYTDNIQNIIFYTNVKQIYKIIIRYYKNGIMYCIHKDIYISKNMNILFNIIIHNIKIILTDKNYIGLKIEKGEILING